LNEQWNETPDHVLADNVDLPGGGIQNALLPNIRSLVPFGHDILIGLGFVPKKSKKMK
jgi:hypothetical protein